MHVLILADNFVPEIAATSFRTMEHAQRWIEQGHEVTVVTCVPNWPHGKAFEGYQNRLYQEERINGVRVIRVWSYMSANKGFLKRTLDYLSFMTSAVLQCWRFPKPDVILATSPQFFTALAGHLVSILRWKPWVFEVRDLWPDSIRAVGASNGPILDVLEKLELYLYRRANRIIALTNAFQDNLTSRGIEKEKIDVVTNGVDMKSIHPNVERQTARERMGAKENEVLAGYVGTTGMAHGLETVLEAANICRNEPQLKFVIMGEGARREFLEQQASQLKLTNLQFLNRVPHAEVPEYLAALDVPIIHLRPDPVFKTVIPSKLFEFMAMKKNVVMAVEGEVAQIVSDADCGLCVPSGDAVALAGVVKQLADDPQLRRRLGENGYRVARHAYRREVKADEALSSLSQACGMPVAVGKSPAILPKNKAA